MVFEIADNQSEAKSSFSCIAKAQNLREDNRTIVETQFKSDSWIGESKITADTGTVLLDLGQPVEGDQWYTPEPVVDEEGGKTGGLSLD